MITMLLPKNFMCHSHFSSSNLHLPGNISVLNVNIMIMVMIHKGKVEASAKREGDDNKYSKQPW